MLGSLLLISSTFVLVVACLCNICNLLCFWKSYQVEKQEVSLFGTRRSPENLLSHRQMPYLPLLSGKIAYQRDAFSRRQNLIPAKIFQFFGPALGNYVKLIGNSLVYSYPWMIVCVAGVSFKGARWKKGIGAAKCTSGTLNIYKLTKQPGTPLVWGLELAILQVCP